MKIVSSIPKTCHNEEPSNQSDGNEKCESDAEGSGNEGNRGI